MAEPEAVADRVGSWPIRTHDVLATGHVFAVVRDTVVVPSGGDMSRDYLQHTGAVAVMAVDEHRRVVVIEQYRHPVGMTLIEAPAGLLDTPGENPLDAAKRELAEEVQLAAADWRVLVDLALTPGASQETLRVFLARDLTPSARPDGFVSEHEEAHLVVHRVPLDELVDAALSGHISNATLVAGTLALAAVLDGDRFADLRPADAPWPARAAKDHRDEETGDHH